MGVWAEMLLNDFPFLAPTADLNIPNDFIKYLDINPRCLQNGTNVLTLANIKAAVPSIIVKLGGVRIASLSYADLLALNVLWRHRAPLLSQPGIANTDNTLGIEGPARLWLYIVKQRRELSAQFGWAAIANADDESLDVKYTYKDTPFPERGNLHYVYETFNGVGAAAVRINISRAGARLVGILTFSEHCGLVAAILEPEASELDVIVDNRLVYHDNWMTRGDEESPHAYADDLINGLQNAAYGWISFEEEPWLADNLWAVVHNTVHNAGGSGQTGVFRLVCIYLEP